MFLPLGGEGRLMRSSGSAAARRRRSIEILGPRGLESDAYQALIAATDLKGSSEQLPRGVIAFAASMFPMRRVQTVWGNA